MNLGGKSDVAIANTRQHSFYFKVVLYVAQGIEHKWSMKTELCTSQQYPVTG
jgi:hypothetical protein